MNSANQERRQFPSLKLTNFKIKDFVTRQVYIGVVGLAESKSGHIFELSLLHFTVILAFFVKIMKCFSKTKGSDSQSNMALLIRADDLAETLAVL